MTDITNLTFSCIELQNIIENADTSEEEKNNLIQNHLNMFLSESSKKEAFPEFQSGWEWFNTERALTVSNDFQGRITVVDFFTYCCINCMHILPDLHALEQKYPTDSTSVAVIGVHSAKFENEKVSSNILAAVQRYGINHPVVNDSEAFLWKTLEITCWPTLLILGPDAKPLFVIIGEGHRDLLFRYVNSSLKFFHDRLLPRPLPLLPNSSKIFQSHLLFPGKICLIHSCSALLLDPSKKYLIVSDTGHHRLIIMDLEGEIKVAIGGAGPGFLDGTFETAKFNSPQGIAFLPPSSIFVADTLNHSIRLIDLESKTVKTVAGTGVQGTDKEGGQQGPEQTLASPWDLCLVRSAAAEDPDMLIIANAGTHQIWGLALKQLIWWKNIKLESGQCIRLAGSGAEENRNNSYPIRAAFAQPSGVCYAATPDPTLFVADSESSSIRQIAFKDGAVKGFVGGDRDPSNLFCYGDKDNTGDPKGAVLLQHPLAVAWNPENGLVYVADSYNHKIKTVDPSTKICSTLLGNGKAGHLDGDCNSDVQFNEPGGLCIDTSLNNLYVADTNNHCIRKICLGSKNANTIDVKISGTPTKETVLSPPNFEVSMATSNNDSIITWDVSFCCPTGWKWATDSPHSWRTVYPEGAQMKGIVEDGQAKISFNPLSLFTNINRDQLFIQIRADLYLCSTATGVCKKRTTVIRLNINQTGIGNEQYVQSEFTIADDK